MAETQTPRQQNSGNSIPIWLIIGIILVIIFAIAIMTLLYQRPSSGSVSAEEMPTQAAVAEAPVITPNATDTPQGPTETPTWTPRPSGTPYLTPTFVNTAVAPEVNTRAAGSIAGGNQSGVIIIGGGSGSPIVVSTITPAIPRSTQTAVAAEATAAYSATLQSAAATRISGVATSIASSATPYPNNWRGAYFDNQTLTGDPVLVRNDAELDFNWGAGSPDPTIPNDHFSARWERSVSLNSATYLFYAYSDDGVRIYLDDVLIIDKWHEAADEMYYATVSVSAGIHTLRVEYYEETGDAQIQVAWDLRNESSWIGEYYRNKSLTGPPHFIRQDGSISFDWGDGGPNGLNQSDNYSIRWLRSSDFEDGRYEFIAKSDDGVLVAVDATLLINEWHDNDTAKTYRNSISLSGKHLVTVEYYKGTGKGSITLDIILQPVAIDEPPTKP